MSQFHAAPPEATADDRLWGALVYFTAPFGPVIALRIPERQAHPYVRAHTLQALGMGLLVALAALLLYIPSFGVSLVLFAVNWLFALRAYRGESFDIPILTEFLKKQGWL